LIKYSPTGGLIWAQLIPGSGFEHVTGISINANSEILITGENFNSVDFDPGPGQWMVAPTAYLAKYSPQANLIWAFSSAGAGSGDHAIEMPSGGIHWVGAMSWSADFDPSANVYLFTPGYLSGVGFFVAKYFPPGLSSGEEPDEAQTLTCYPNPAHHTITISCTSQMNKVEINNIQGALLSSYECNTKELLIDVSAFNPGLYFISTTTATGTSCSPLLVDHQ
jgi:hypothetical protein